MFPYCVLFLDNNVGTAINFGIKGWLWMIATTIFWALKKSTQCAVAHEECGFNGAMREESVASPTFSFAALNTRLLMYRQRDGFPSLTCFISSKLKIYIPPNTFNFPTPLGPTWWYSYTSKYIAYHASHNCIIVKLKAKVQEEDESQQLEMQWYNWKY